MCGIAGIVTVPEKTINPRAVGLMTAAQAHRGPDGEGYVFLSQTGRLPPHTVRGPLVGRVPAEASYSVGLGHRRLAILDLSEAGHQPMSTSDGRLWVTYNGEIYNYREVREELRGLGHVFRSQSDTEVLLAAYREWGPQCLPRFNGMFAFALWDTERRALFCARDRMGEKPFFYLWDGATFAFASELKALLQVIKQPTPNRRLVYAYLDGARLDFSDETFLEGVRQLPPAHSLLVSQGTLAQRRYWDLTQASLETPLRPADANEHFRHLFYDAVRVRLRSDVPVGSCLSGGLDSSAIVCVAQEVRDDRGAGGPANSMHTFSACFDDPRFDERRFIRQVVERTGVESHRTFPTAKELETVLERLIWQQDEPFGSTSIFAQWAVMRSAAERGVKVLLDGQGADELMAGYHGCFGAHFADLFRQRRWIELWKQGRAYGSLHARLPPQIPANFLRGLCPPEWVCMLRRLYQGSPQWMAPELLSAWRSAEDRDRADASLLQGMQHRLLTRHGLRALLRYEDRNAMAFGVETRLPFLDVRLVEFLFRLDSGRKLNGGWTKVILREALEGVLPPGITWRADKIGFATPEDDWFRGDLAAIARDVLLDRRARDRGFLSIPQVERELARHVAGQQAIGSTIWRWVNLEVWCRLFLDRHRCAASLS